MLPIHHKEHSINTLIDVAIADGYFETLAKALTAAGLVATLKGRGPFTVFASTDEAFAKIAKADLDALLKDKAKLKAVLTYHVVPGKVMTVQGSDVTVSTMGGAMVNNARVVSANVTADSAEVEDALARRQHYPGHVAAEIHAAPGSAGAQTSAAPDSVPPRAGPVIYKFGQVARAGGAASGAASPQAGTSGRKPRRVRGELRASPPGAAELGQVTQARVRDRPGALPELRWRAEDHGGDP